LLLLLLLLKSCVCKQEMIEVHRGREDSKAKAQATAKANSLVECQPNTGAPLLRDEKARRDWVERELDICCQVTPCLTVLDWTILRPKSLQHSCIFRQFAFGLIVYSCCICI